MTKLFLSLFWKLNLIIFGLNNWGTLQLTPIEILLNIGSNSFLSWFNSIKWENLFDLIKYLLYNITNFN